MEEEEQFDDWLKWLIDESAIGRLEWPIGYMENSLIWWASEWDAWFRAFNDNLI